MTATRIRPQTCAVIFVRSPLLKKHFTLAVENENTESPVQNGLVMRIHFLHDTYFIVRFIYQYNLLFQNNIFFGTWLCDQFKLILHTRPHNNHRLQVIRNTDSFPHDLRSLYPFYPQEQ